jgi:integrase
LVTVLRERRKRYPHTRLIFQRSNGGPDYRLLAKFKRLALRASVNCGHCVNKRGKSCADSPVCFQIGLHRLRKTFATMHHQNGMSVHTLMRLLRHSNLEITLRYLADQPDDQMRSIVDSTFEFAHAVSAAAENHP